MRLLHRMAKANRLSKLLAAHDRYEADLAAIRGEPQARAGRTCRDCGNRAGSGECRRACGGAR